jgi:tripartite-type tricarboxylate transporter receptor subunit TctC
MAIRSPVGVKQGRLGGDADVVGQLGDDLCRAGAQSCACGWNNAVLSHDHTVSILPLVVKNPGFEPARDFAAVGGFATFVNALALSGGTPAKSLPDYVNWVRTQGSGKGTVGVPAPASVPEFLVKMIGQKYKLDLQSAPYRGSAPMMGDMLGNQIAAGTASIPDFIENHKAENCAWWLSWAAPARPFSPTCQPFPNWV